MNIKNDYSFLFDSMNNSGSNAGNNIFNSIDLGEYHNIKSGTYGKLLKAYFAKADNTEVELKDDKDTKKKKLEDDTAVEKLTEVSAGASALEDSAEKLIARGMDSLFREKELTVKDEDGKETKVMGYDTEAIYNAVKDFTDKYNSFVKSVNRSDSAKLERELDNMTGIVSDYAQVLEEVGITINKDDTLTVDKETLKASDISDLKKLFNGNTSFTYQVSTKASMIGVSANSEANTMKNYTNTGSYNKSFSSGNLLDSLI